MNEIQNINKEELKLKRLLGIDFGMVRVGLALSDALHISTTPLETLQYKDNNFWNNLSEIINKNNVGGIVVGIPIYEAETETHSKLISNINIFVNKLKKITSLPIFMQDECLTSKKAVTAMIEMGKKKKFRSTKGNTDKIAAAIILQEFLNNLI